MNISFPNSIPILSVLCIVVRVKSCASLNVIAPSHLRAADTYSVYPGPPPCDLSAPFL